MKRWLQNPFVLTVGVVSVLLLGIASLSLSAPRGLGISPVVPSGGSSSGGQTFTSANKYNDDVPLNLGTNTNGSLRYATTGTGSTTPGHVMALDASTPSWYIICQSNIGFDPIGVDASSFFDSPTVFFFSCDQAKNEHTRISTSNDRVFSTTGSDGDHLDGTATTDAGIGISFNTGQGGTLTTGGKGGDISFRSSDGGGTNSNGGDITFDVGELSGTGTNGVFTVSWGGMQAFGIGATGDTTINLMATSSNAYRITHNSADYFQISTTGTPMITFGNGTTNPRGRWDSSSTFDFFGNINLSGNDADISIITSQQSTSTAFTAILTGLNSGGGSGASVVLASDSTDVAGTITATAGNGTPVAGAIATVSLTGYTNTIQPIVTACDDDAGDLNVYATNISTSGFDVGIREAPAASEVFVVCYFIIQTVPGI